jgi:hypothetical protein
MNRLRKALPLLFLAAALLWVFAGRSPITPRPAYAQGSATPVDCNPATMTFTSATTGTVYQNSNSGTPCVSWRVTYNSTGFSALSIQIETRIAATSLRD